MKKNNLRRKGINLVTLLAFSVRRLHSHSSYMNSVSNCFGVAVDGSHVSTYDNTMELYLNIYISIYYYYCVRPYAHFSNSLFSVRILFLLTSTTNRSYVRYNSILSYFIFFLLQFFVFLFRPSFSFGRFGSAVWSVERRANFVIN